MDYTPCTNMVRRMILSITPGNVSGKIIVKCKKIVVVDGVEYEDILHMVSTWRIIKVELFVFTSC